MDEFLQAVQHIDPLWSVVLVAVALIVLLVARFWRASFGRMLAIFVALAVVGSAVTAAYFGYAHFEETRRLTERRGLDERATALFQQAVQPGSVFACLDGSPVPSLMEACEQNLFAEPQRVAAAVAVVTQRLGLLSDATEYARERDPDYLVRIEPMRKSLESDPFGLVAFVLSVEHNCTAESCKRLELLRDPSRVTENMRVRRFEAFLAKHSPDWGSPAPTAAAVQPETPAPNAPKTSPFVTISEPVTAPVNVPPISEAVPPAVPTPAAASAPAPETPAAADAPVTAAAPAAPAAASSSEAAAKESPRPEAASAPAAAAKGAASAPASPPAAQAKNPPPSRPAAAGQPKAKAKADPVTRRSSEPVAGLPRIVPRDFIREKEEAEEALAAQASGQSAQPGPPTPIIPQQNFTVQ